MKYWLGIDTSAYTTSVAAAGADGPVLDLRRLLETPKGQRGLRQSDAFYQHWSRLPKLISEAMEQFSGMIEGICVSEKPRPAEGSYMPVFNSGVQAAEVLASALRVPVFRTSHQEGHIMAAAYGSGLDLKAPLVFAHLSGGTLELVYFTGGKAEIIGATKDISYGQLIDRFGVDMGFSFPSGKYVDDLAISHVPEGRKSPLPAVFTDKTYISLSGIEDALKRTISSPDAPGPAELSYWLMTRVAESLCRILDCAAEETGCGQILIGGGVACSGFVRRYCEERGKAYVFGQPRLCSDNAVGVALMRGESPWL